MGAAVIGVAAVSGGVRQENAPMVVRLHRCQRRPRRRPWVRRWLSHCAAHLRHARCHRHNSYRNPRGCGTGLDNLRVESRISALGQTLLSRPKDDPSDGAYIGRAVNLSEEPPCLCGSGTLSRMERARFEGLSRRPCTASQTRSAAGSTTSTSWWTTGPAKPSSSARVSAKGSTCWGCSLALALRLAEA